jgi:hypothetical protein
MQHTALRVNGASFHLVDWAKGHRFYCFTVGRPIPAQGTRVMLAVRPEKLIVESSDDGPTHALPAQIEALVYVGTAVHIHLRTGTGTRLVAYRQNTTPMPSHLHPGARVHVSWDAAAARLVE